MSGTIFLDFDPELRRRIDLEVEDAVGARPDCHLAHSVGADADGRIFLHFTCLTHGATWRSVVAVRGATRNVVTVGDAHAPPATVGVQGPAAASRSRSEHGPTGGSDER